MLPPSGFELSLPIKLMVSRRAACKTDDGGKCVCITRIIRDKTQGYFGVLYVRVCDAFVSDFEPLWCHSNAITKWCSAEYEDSATLTLLPSTLICNTQAVLQRDESGVTDKHTLTHTNGQRHKDAAHNAAQATSFTYHTHGSVACLF